MATHTLGARQARVAHRLGAAISLTIFAGLASPGAAIAADDWEGDFHVAGIDGRVHCGAVVGSDLYVGGQFLAAGSVAASSVARWDGAAWHALGDGLDGIVYDLMWWNGDLYACGEFLHTGEVTVNRVARWDGETWHALADGLYGGPYVYQYALAVYDGQLWCGGYRWDGESWTDVLQTDAVVRTLAVHDGRLVAGGNFTTAGGEPQAYVVAWDGDGLVALPGQPYPPVDLLVFAGQLYALIGYSDWGVPSPVTVWSGGAWLYVGEFEVETDHQYRQLVDTGGSLSVLFNESPVIPPVWSGRLATLVEDNWQLEFAYDSVDPHLYLGYGGDWVLGGEFAVLDDVLASDIALLGATGPRALGEGGCGISGAGAVQAFCVTPDGLVVGGSFEAAGDLRSASVALWDGGEWQGRSLPHAWVTSLAYHDNQLHAFFARGDVVAARHAVWDGSQWETMAVGGSHATVGSAVSYAGMLIGAGEDLYDWSPAGGPQLFAATQGMSHGLAIWDGSLVVGGEFTSVGGVTAYGVALHDETGWHALGGGIDDGEVLALAEYAGNLVAAGEFTVAGGVAARNVAIWNGATWSPLGGGLPGQVQALASYNGYLYAGGNFTMDDGSGVQGLARWDGRDWHGVGGGTGGVVWTNEVTALAVHADRLYLGGGFSLVGGKPAARFAVWNGEAIADVPSVSTSGMRLDPPVPNPFNPVALIRFRLNATAPVDLTVYDAAGRRVRTVVTGQWPTGEHAVIWDGRDESGRTAAAGSYLAVLRAGGEQRTQKLSLVK